MQILGHNPREHMKVTYGFTNRKSATYASDQKMVSHSKKIAFMLNGFLMKKTADAQIFMPTSNTQQCVSNAE